MKTKTSSMFCWWSKIVNKNKYSSKFLAVVVQGTKRVTVSVTVVGSISTLETKYFIF